MSTSAHPSRLSLDYVKMSLQREPHGLAELRESIGACFLPAPDPPDEIARLNALKNLRLLDTPGEERFDDIVGLAARLFDVPIAYIALVAEARQWFKSAIGMPVTETPRKVSFCGYTILQEKPLIIRDTLADPIFATNPLVVGEPHLRFYAGQSLRDPSGYRVGTLCIADRRPKEFNDRDVDILHRLALLVERELNMLDVMRLQEFSLNMQQQLIESRNEVVALMTQVQAERDKSDSLLFNILPENVAAELKECGRVKAIHLDAACVLFADFTDFTRISADLSPEELVEELNVCFSAFDEITVKYGVEKLKTLGDGYLCISGSPSRPNDALDMARTALEICRFVADRKATLAARGREYWNVRVGLHRGPLVAGVVGVRKFSFDVWGDTVNTASRIQNSSQPGRISMSREFWCVLPAGAVCESRGEVAVKGKGMLEMFFLNDLHCDTGST